ncbi:MAG TPA: ABC transporter substrate-binding protein [Chroococcidiopsis sp.]
MLNSHRWTRRQTLWLLAGAAGGVTLHACKPSAQTPSDGAASGQSSSVAPAATSASLGVTTWIGNAAIYIAQSKGFFTETGLALDLKTFASVAEGFPAFTAGQLQAIAPVTSEAVTLAANGVDYRIVAVTDTSVGADGILARGSVASVADFKGRKIAVQEGGVGHFFLLQVLAEAGLTGNDVELLNIAPDASAAAYEAGNVDVAYSYSPFIEKANKAQPDGRIIYDTSKMPTAIADVIAFRNDVITDNPAAVQAFINGMFKGVEFLKSNADEALAIASEPLGVKPEELAEQLKGVQLPDLATNLKMVGDPQSDLYLKKPMDALAQFLKDQKQIDTIPDLSTVLDPQFLLGASF